VLHKTYRVEMQSTLRLEDQGALPTSTHLDISDRPKQRVHYDDWDFFLHEVKPQPFTEWVYMLSWLVRGASDGSTTTSCLARPETTLGGVEITRTECLLERPFSAGTLRCVLVSVDEPATEVLQWKIGALQVLISDGFLPGGPLETWHDAEPFADAPPPEEEGEEGEPPA